MMIWRFRLPNQPMRPVRTALLLAGLLLATGCHSESQTPTTSQPATEQPASTRATARDEVRLHHNLSVSLEFILSHHPPGSFQWEATEIGLPYN